MLLEVKKLHVGTSTYPAAAADQQCCLAVARRQMLSIPGTCTCKARRVERRVTQPLEKWGQWLRTHDPIKGLVFGAWSEESPAVNALLD